MIACVRLDVPRMPRTPPPIAVPSWGSMAANDADVAPAPALSAQRSLQLGSCRVVARHLLWATRPPLPPPQRLRPPSYPDCYSAPPQPVPAQRRDITKHNAASVVSIRCDLDPCAHCMHILPQSFRFPLPVRIPSPQPRSRSLPSPPLPSPAPTAAGQGREGRLEQRVHARHAGYEEQELGAELRNTVGTRRWGEVAR